MEIFGSQEAARLDALDLRTFYVVRHAKAGSRSHWTGDDRKRPLSKKGVKQAEELVHVFAKLPIDAILSSPYLRCVQTVEPLARARGLAIKQTASLAEGHGLSGLQEFFNDSKLNHAVLSTHGDIAWELVEDLVNRHVIKAGDGGFDKGSTWVLHLDDGNVAKAEYIAAP